MATLNLDVGSFSCVGGCEHCQFGRNISLDLVTFMPEIILLTERLLSYSRDCGDEIRIAFLNSLLTLPGDISFVEKADTLSVSLSSLDELRYQRREILERIAGFAGHKLEFHFNHFVLTPDLVSNFLPPAIFLIHGACEVLPDLKEVTIGFNHNTVKNQTRNLLAESVVIGNCFRVYTEAYLGIQEWCGATKLIQITSGPVMKLSVVVPDGQRRYSLEMRYVLAPDSASVYKLSPISFENKDVNLLITDRGVHMAHFTHSINQNELWFTYDEFGGLLDQAIIDSVPLNVVCRKTLEARRK